MEIKTFPANEVPEKWSVVDTAPESVHEIMPEFLEGARMVIYNGALGLYQNRLFGEATREVIFSLEDLKRKNSEVKIVVLGGDGTTVLVKYLGEERAKELAYLSSEMGGAGWKYLLGKPLPALDYVHRKKLDLKENNVNGVIDYSNLVSINDLPCWYWQDKLALVDVLVIADLNIGKTKNMTEDRLLKFQKIRTIIKVIKDLRERMGENRKIIIITHNGRFKDYHKKLKVSPPDGTVDPDYSVEQMAKILTVLLRKEGVFKEMDEITFVPYSVLPETAFENPEIKNGNVIFLENPRFWKDETSKDKDIALEHSKKIWRAVKFVSNPTICVQAAMGALHRDQASRRLITQFVMGPRVVSLPVKEELAKLYEIGTNPERPVVAIISGNKKEKIEDVIKPLIEKRKVNKIFIGGKIVMAFIHKEPLAVKIMELAEENGIKIYLPKKVVAAKIPSEMTEAEFISALKK